MANHHCFTPNTQIISVHRSTGDMGMGWGWCMIIFGTWNIQTKKGESERFLLGGWRFVSVHWVPRSKEESLKKYKRFMK